MKRLIAILLLLLLVFALAACGGESDAPDGMKNVATENAKYYLYVPEGWFEQSVGECCGAMAPLGNANVIATTYLADTVYTSKSYWDEKCLALFATTFSEFSVVEGECKETTLGGLAAYQCVFTHKSDGKLYKQMQVIAVDGNMVYTLQYTASTDDYATNLEDVESIRAHFTVR